jgi:O-methyltransferase involved in polyketide biosynthesis
MASIGPTAFYTGEVWARHGLSHPELARAEGRLLHLVTEPTMLVSRLLGGPTLEGMLLGRHKVIDALLEEALDSGTVGQVLEVAAGMSPRGWRFTERHPDLLYVEADLPDMAARKREALERIGRPDTHRVAELDALTSEGPLSLQAVAERELDPSAGLAIITEGLLSYLPRDPVLSLWSGFGAAIARCGGGLYLSDLHVDSDTAPLMARVFAGILSAFVLGPVRLHFADAEEARDALLDAGFDDASVEPVDEYPQGAGRPGAEHVRVVRATVG